MLHIASPALPFIGPHEPGTAGYRAFLNVQASNAMGEITRMLCAGTTPHEVAGFILSLGIVGASVSRMIEDASHPGTFAEAVFNILAG